MYSAATCIQVTPSATASTLQPIITILDVLAVSASVALPIASDSQAAPEPPEPADAART